MIEPLATVWSVKHSIMSALQEETPGPIKTVLKPLYHLGRQPIKKAVKGYRIMTRPAYSKPGAPPRFFTFNNQEYRYFYHRYNLTWRNERALEIPIAWNMVQESGAENTLEVGNVLSHYFDISHEVVDKYEKSQEVISEDILDFHPERRYNLIVCISTLEHVGFDKPPRDTRKALPAFENMVGMLNPGGTILVTLPVSRNIDIIGFVVDGEINFSELHGFKKISKDNMWVEVEPRIARDITMAGPYPVNAFLIGIYRK